MEPHIARRRGAAVLRTPDETLTLHCLESTPPPIQSSQANLAHLAERPVPAGFVLHTESTTSILFASVEDPTGKPQVFLNPVQQYNRDLSIVAIRTWSEQRQKERAAAWEASIRKRRAKGPMKRRAPGGETEEEGGSKRRKVEDGEVEVSARPVVTEVRGSSFAGRASADERLQAQETDADPNRLLPPVPTFTFTCLEALSATGLRAIRYAKEIPLLRLVFRWLFDWEYG